MRIEELEEDGAAAGAGSAVAAKRAAVGVGAWVLFYPTLVYNVIRNKVQPEFHWWDEVDEGNMAYKGKQWQKAISLYTEAIKLSGKTATYYSNRAAAYLELGSYLQAEADCSTAIDLDKSFLIWQHPVRLCFVARLLLCRKLESLI